MKQVNIHEAKTHLSQLIADVEGGEEVVIARAGSPVVRLVREALKPKVLREPGRLKGKMWVSDDWDSPEVNAEIAAMMEWSESDDELFGPPPK